MAGEKLLSESSCKAAKAKHKIYYLNDGAGLRLRCRPNGSRTWIFRYRFNSKEKNIGLGSYPQVSLQIARAKATKSRLAVIEGKNPSIEKKINKARIEAQELATFGVVAREWLSHNEARWSINYYKRNEGLLRRFLLPDLGRLPIQDIEESYLFTVLKPVYDRGTKESARRAREVAAQIFTYGKDTHRCSHNPAKDMAKSSYFIKPEIKHFKAISQQDAPELVAELNKSGKDQRLRLLTTSGLLLALYTGLRDHSIRGAQWKEIDLQSEIWTVPGTRMKSGRVHQVPLPLQAIAKLESLKTLTDRGPDSFIFSANTKSGYMAENTLRLALHRLGYKVTLHGFRSLITDVLNENGFNADAIERQLDHQERSQVRRAYLRSDFIEEREKMMQWFADWCEGKTAEYSSQNVVNMQVRR